MSESTKTFILGLIVLGIIAVCIRVSIKDSIVKQPNYAINQKIIQLKNCKTPCYNDKSISNMRYFYEPKTMYVVFKNGDTLLLTSDQIMNILCK
jgi:hypothetical protein